MSATEAALVVETDRLTRRYGDVLAVDQVDLSVPRGAVYGFLGPNGAGKTTTLRLLLGLIRPTSGSVRLLGQPLTTASRSELLGSVGALIEEPSLYRHLTGRENVEATRVLLGLPRASVGRVLDIVGLRATDADRRVQGYSQGMRQRLGLALTLLPSPRLLILDEPANGLDPDGLQDIRDVLSRLHQEGRTTVLVSSHQLGEVERVATHIGVMRGGRLVRQGPLADLLGQLRGLTRIRVGDSTRAADALAQRGIDASAQADAVTLDDPSDEATAAAIAAIVHAGVDVYDVRPEAPPLETFFFSLEPEAGASSTPA